MTDQPISPTQILEKLSTGPWHIEQGARVYGPAPNFPLIADCVGSDRTRRNWASDYTQIDANLRAIALLPEVLRLLAEARTLIEHAVKEGDFPHKMGSEECCDFHTFLEKVLP